MNTKPILFSAPMVRALLDGSKTQTRRVVKDQSIGEKFCEIRTEGAYLEWQGTPCAGSGVWDVPEYSAVVRSPYGVPGDRLWVREAIELVPDQEPDDGTGRVLSRYRADGSLTVADAWPWQRKFLPPMHCPRGLSRITLEVTDVRVERLQDISDADAIAEGVERCTSDTSAVRDALVNGSIHVDRYASLWGSLNGPGSWDLNPFVWVVSFRRV